MGEIVGCKNILSSIMDTFCKLCIGQSLEEKLIANLKVTEKDYYEVVKLKTAVFFSMVCEVSAILADADFETISKFKKLGLSMGMAFQIRDDLLDYSLEKIDSKSKDIDINKRLVTLPIIIAYKKSSKANKYILTTYYSEQRSIETEHIHKVVHESGAYKETIDVIDGYLDRCLEILTGIKKLRGDTLILNKMITDLRVRGELLEGII